MSRLSEVLGVEERQPFVMQDDNRSYFVHGMYLYRLDRSSDNLKFVRAECYKDYAYFIADYKKIEIIDDPVTQALVDATPPFGI